HPSPGGGPGLHRRRGPWDVSSSTPPPGGQGRAPVLPFPRVIFISRTMAALLIASLGACSHAPRPAAPTDPQVPAPLLPGPDDGEINAATERHVSSLVELYRHFHANPELSYQEVKTA